MLVPTDFSEISRHAVAYVLAHYRDQLSEIILLHAYRDNASAPLISLVDILKEKSERMLHREVELLQKKIGKDAIGVKQIARYDALVTAMKEVSEQEDVDMVVMGTNGHTHPRVEFKDDDPSFLLARINRPMLLVPQYANIG